MTVYPRACGGTSFGEALLGIDGGLSPRVRGNQGGDRLRQSIAGSIPARAGEPTTRDRSPVRKRVYPRACGGTGIPMERWAADLGLSPRVRGNRHFRVPADGPRGSIPARAGEPAAYLTSGTSYTVYPRACGGTFIALP